MQRYLCHHAGTNYGPLTHQEILNYVQSGGLSPESLVQIPQTGQWVPVTHFLQQPQQPVIAQPAILGGQPGLPQQQGAMPLSKFQRPTSETTTQTPTAIPQEVSIIGNLYYVYALLSAFRMMIAADFEKGTSGVIITMLITMLVQVLLPVMYGRSLLNGSSIKPSETLAKVLFALSLIGTVLVIGGNKILSDQPSAGAQGSFIFFAAISVIETIFWGCAAYYLGREKTIVEYERWSRSKPKTI